MFGLLLKMRSMNSSQAIRSQLKCATLDYSISLVSEALGGREGVRCSGCGSHSQQRSRMQQATVSIESLGIGI